LGAGHPRLELQKKLGVHPEIFHLHFTLQIGVALSIGGFQFQEILNTPICYIGLKLFPWVID
jgi:hypothetical protein